MTRPEGLSRGESPSVGSGRVKGRRAPGELAFDGRGPGAEACASQTLKPSPSCRKLIVPVEPETRPTACGWEAIQT